MKASYCSLPRRAGIGTCRISSSSMVPLDEAPGGSARSISQHTRRKRTPGEPTAHDTSKRVLRSAGTYTSTCRQGHGKNYVATVKATGVAGPGLGGPSCDRSCARRNAACYQARTLPPLPLPPPPPPPPPPLCSGDSGLGLPQARAERTDESTVAATCRPLCMTCRSSTAARAMKLSYARRLSAVAFAEQRHASRREAAPSPARAAHCDSLG